MSGENDTDRTLWLASDAIVCHVTIFTDLTAGEAMVLTFLPRKLAAASRIQNQNYGK